MTISVMLIVLLIVFLAINALITWWLTRRKPGAKFSGLSLCRLLGIGALSGIIPVLFGLLVPDFTGLHPLLCGVLTGLLEYALVKEVFKYFALRLAMRGMDEVACRYDVVLASCLIAVGFTLAEGIITMFFSGASGLLMTLLPYHILFAVVTGFFLSRFLATGRSGDRVLALVVPIVLHTVFEMWHFALIVAYGDALSGTMTQEEISALPYIGLVRPLQIVSYASYGLFVVLIIAAFIAVGVWGKKEKLRESIR